MTGADQVDLNKLKRYAFLTVSTYVLFLSLLPLMSDITSSGKWVGYGWGAYNFENDMISVRFSEVMFGADKPKVLMRFFMRYVDIIEFSDHESYVNGFNVHYECNVTNIVVVEPMKIVHTYLCGKDDTTFIMNKTTTILPDNAIELTIHTQNDAIFKVSLWRWYYESVNNVTLTGKQGIVRLGERSNITFTFLDRELGRFKGVVTVSKPVNVSVHSDEKAINKIVIEKNSQTLQITVRTWIAEESEPSILTSFLKNVFSTKMTRFALPVVAVVCIFLGWRKWMRT